MKLKMTVGLSGNEYSLSPGDEREFPDAEAGRLIDAGYAVLAEEDPEGEADVVSRKGRDGSKRRTGKSAGSEAPGQS